MKTVLKEFLDLLKAETIEYYNIINNESDYHYEDVQSARTSVTDLEKLLEKGNEFLEREKKQIIDAGNKCVSNWILHDPERHGNRVPEGIDYYLKTFDNS